MSGNMMLCYDQMHLNELLPMGGVLLNVNALILLIKMVIGTLLAYAYAMRMH